MRRLNLMRLSRDSVRKILPKAAASRLQVVVLDFVRIHIFLLGFQHIVCVEL